MARKSLNKKTRFEVFKRDSFRCQYCGQSAPDVVLHVDHIKPVASDGGNEIINLITSCSSCNGGKGAIDLDDNSAIQKQKKQLEELNERRHQLEMMMKWREELGKIDNDKVQHIYDGFAQQSGYSPNESGKDFIRKWVKQFPFNILLDSLDASVRQYVKKDKDNKPTLESAQKAFDYIPRIAAVKKRGEKPYYQSLSYVRAIIKNKFTPYWLQDLELFRMLENYHHSGVSIENLIYAAKTARTLGKFWYLLDQYKENDNQDEQGE